MSTNVIQFPKRSSGVRPRVKALQKGTLPARRAPEPDGWVDLNEYLIANQEHTYIVRKCGDDAENGILTGDMLVVDRSVKPNKGDLVIYNAGGSLVTRRFVSAHLRLATSGSAARDAAQVFGVVIHHIRTRRLIEPPMRKRSQ